MKGSTSTIILQEIRKSTHGTVSIATDKWYSKQAIAKTTTAFIIFLLIVYIAAIKEKTDIILHFEMCFFSIFSASC